MANASRALLLPSLLIGLVGASRIQQHEGLLMNETGQCEAWCARKVENPKMDGGKIASSELCAKDAEGKPWNKQCTWDIVCSYGSGKCSGCAKCKSRCDAWCEPKIGKKECGA